MVDQTTWVTGERKSLLPAGHHSLLENKQAKRQRYSFIADSLPNFPANSQTKSGQIFDRWAKKVAPNRRVAEAAEAVCLVIVYTDCSQITASMGLLSIGGAAECRI